MLTAILQRATLALTPTSDSPRLDAEVLLSHALACNRSQLRLKTTLTDTQLSLFQALVTRRQQRIPIAYLIGQKEFWSLMLMITPAVLVPRPETELLVETVLHLISHKEAHIADLGTGSGAIALALVSERLNWRVTATDLSQAALDIAIQNATHLQLHHLTFKLGSWTDAFAPNDRFDAIVSNPPYLAMDDPYLVNTDISHEPVSALVADNQGLAAYQTITTHAINFLKPGGYLCFEHGATQAACVRAILQHHAFVTITTLKDLAGLDRVTYGHIRL